MCCTGKEVGLRATGGRTFPAGAKLGQRQEDSRHPWERVASGNAPRPWVSPLPGGSKGLPGRHQETSPKLLGSPRAMHLSPSHQGPSCPALTKWQVRGNGVPVAHHLLSNPSFPVCGEIELVFLSPPGVSFSEAPFALRWKGMVWVEQTQLSGGNAVQSLLQKEELRPQPGGFWPWLGCSH